MFQLKQTEYQLYKVLIKTRAWICEADKDTDIWGFGKKKMEKAM